MTDAITLTDLLDEVADEVDGVERTVDGEAVSYSVSGTVFAASLEGGLRAAFRLRPDIVRGALATPDTRPSARGRDWVEYAPEVVDAFGVDRLDAWFVLGHRLADPRARRPTPIPPPDGRERSMR